jgi:hypothetical protein
LSSLLGLGWTSGLAVLIYLGTLAGAVLAILGLRGKLGGWLWPAEPGRALVVVAGPIHGTDTDDGIAYDVPARNAGDASATKILVTLVDSRKETVGKAALIDRLVPGEVAHASVLTPPRDRFSGPYEVRFEWRQGRRTRRAASGVTVGAP